MLRKTKKEKQENTRRSGLREFVLSGLIFGIALLWTHSLYFDADGKIYTKPLWITVAAFALTFVLALVLQKLPQNRKGSLSVLWEQLGLIFTAITVEVIFLCFTSRDGILTNMLGHDLWFYLRNFLLLFLIAQILYLILGKVYLCFHVLSVLSFFAAAIDYYVILYRWQPVMPWDLSAIVTAKSVVSSYAVNPVNGILYAFFVWMLATQIVKWICEEEGWKPFKERWQSLVLSGIAIFVYVFAFEVNMPDMFWDYAMESEDYGTVPTFVHFIPYAFSQKPEGYSTQEAEDTLNAIEPVVSDDAEITPVNLIVIMNESFSDLRVYGNENFSWEYTPFLDSLTENTVKGNLYVPVFGGNTCNSEFEFLTGASCRYYKGLPYQTLFKVNCPVDAMTWTLKDQGYSLQAFHPYLLRNWNRETVYADMGFQDMYDMNAIDYENEKIRWTVRDDADYAFVIENYEAKDAGEYFMFNVTMQNHGGYEETYDNFTTDVDLSADGTFPQAETYLGLIEESDKAFQELVEYFSQVEEPTMICMFGDHQAAIEDSFYEYLYGKPLSEWTEEELQNRYITPFIIWANYDIEEAYVDKISVNYLSAYLMKTANLELDAYESYLYQLFQKYPVISGSGIYDADGNFYGSDTEIDQKEDLLEYQKLQYYRIYDAMK
jgi:phosphoglycerol transferase MdoB-like AlkP superfamily enzyme